MEVVSFGETGSSYGQLPVPVRSGYQFVAWRDDKGNTIYSGSTVEPDTEKLSCVWSKTLKFWANSYINGQSNEYFKNCGYATLYINGKLYTKDQDFLYTDKLKTGDIFKLDNISAQDGYVYTGFRNGVGTEFQYEYYENGLVKSISGQVKEDNIGIYCDFESDNVLQNIIRQYNIKEIDVDSTPPITSVTSIGSTNLFASKDDCYVIDNTLHIYNPEGGKVVAPVDSTNLFGNLTIVKLNLQGLDTAQVKYATGMFRNNYYMTDLNVSSFVTSRFESMESMFEKCNGLTNLDVSKFDTSNATKMFRLFFDCNYIKTLNIEKWNTSNVNTMGYMFANCSSLQSVNLKNLDTSSCNNFFDMFGNCMSLTSLDVSQFKTSNVKNSAWMFYNTTSLKELKGFESWDLSQVNNISWMFACSGLSEIHFPKSGDILAINDVFNTCANLVSVDLSKLNLNNANDWQEAFQKCPKLQTIYVADDFSNKSATSQNTFYNCTSLVGGSGAKYDPTFIDSTGARIDGGPSNPGYFTAISDKPLETTQTNEEIVNQTTNVEAPVKEPNELESDSKQNETESQQ